MNIIQTYLTDTLERNTNLSPDELAQIELLESVIQKDELNQTEFNLYFRLILSVILKSDVDNKLFEKFISSTKTFFDYHIGNDEWNERGLHIARLVIAHYAVQKRFGNQKFLEDGYIIYEDIFEEEIVECIVDELKKQEYSVNKQPHNIIVNKSGILHDVFFRERYFVMEKVLDAMTFSEHLKKEFEKYYNENTFAQRIIIEPDDNDNQKNIHMDTFFPALKFWYFPEGTTEDGTFNFAPGTTKLNKNLLDYYFRESVKCSKNTFESWKLKDHKEGSLRISEEELNEMGYFLKPMILKPNSLIIANVFGFHKRGETTKTIERISVHGSIRIEKPFKLY